MIERRSGIKILIELPMYKGDTMDERLKKQLDFILEIDKEKNILRQTHLSGHGRRERFGARMAYGDHGIPLARLFQ